MELALIRSLMEKDFYDNHRGAKCPDRLFSKDVRKIKQALDIAMQKYERSVTPDEIHALFVSGNPSMTTAQKNAFEGLFNQIKKEKTMGEDIAQEVLSKLFQQVVGEDIANIGFDYVNGSLSTLEPIRNVLETYSENLIPNINVTWDDIDVDTLLSMNDLEARWTFNIESLARKIGGINAGHLIEVGARPNTGKTSFHASLLVGDNGFARQGAKCVVLCNEESYDRVGFRYLTASSNMDKYQIKDNPSQARDRYKEISPNLKIKDVTGEDMSWVESMCKSVNPDVVVIDMGDKFARTAGYARPDEALKANAIYARQIAKQYDCVIFYMSQLNAEAEGRQRLNQAMMEGSRTGKAAEADLMILIGQPASVEGIDEESTMRHLNVVKNKITGWHGMINCNINPHTARYSA